MDAGTTVRGADFYNFHAVPQHAAAVNGALPMLEEAIAGFRAAVTADRGTGQSRSPIVVGDYGCAGGRNSIEPIAAMIAGIRSVHPTRPIVVAYIDQPANDFSPLFHDEADNADPMVFPIIVGRSFYGPVLPPGTVSLGWSSHSVHWLSRAPTIVPDHVFIPMATEEVRERWAARAAADWHAFLAHRAAELEPDGQLVIELAALGPDGTGGSEPLYGVLDEAIAILVERGRLAKAEADRIAMPVYNRTERELISPFQSAEIGALLRLDALRIRSSPDPFLEAFERTGDARAFAACWTATVRAFSEQAFFTPSGLPGRSDSGRAELAEGFYQLVFELIAADPLRASNHWNVADLRIVRTEAALE
jgi:hypothetical protein